MGEKKITEEVEIALPKDVLDKLSLKEGDRVGFKRVVNGVYIFKEETSEDL